MSLPVNQETKHLLSTASSAGLNIRRNPLTGELVSLSQNRFQTPSSRLRALNANAEPLETEKFGGAFEGAKDPLSHLDSASGHSPQLPAHTEMITAFTTSIAHSAQLLFDRYVERFEELIPHENIAEISIAETHFEQSAHAELSGFSEPTELTETINFQAERWARRRASDLLSDILVSEIVDQRRILINSEHWVAFVPYAALSPLHILLLPKAPRRNLVGMTDSEQFELASLHQRLVTLISEVSGENAQQNVLWSMAPIPHCRTVSRMRVEFTANYAGENPSESPEDLAHRLREFLELEIL